MPLRQKLFFGISTSFVVLVVLVYITSHVVLLAGYTELEQHETSKQVDRAYDMYLNDLAELDSLVYDWAAWDDTYAFIEDKNEDYIQSNVVDLVFVNLELNALVYVDSSGRVVLGRGYDDQVQMSTDITPGLQARFVPEDPLITHLEATSKLAGVLLLPEGPMLVASRPILTSLEEGPIRGTLVMGRYLDSDKIQNFSNLSHLTIKFYLYSASDLPDEIDVVRKELSAQNPIIVEPLNEQTVAGYTVINDIDGKPALIMAVEEPRYVYQVGITSIRFFGLWLVAIGAIFGVASFVLVDKLFKIQQERLRAEEEIRQAEEKFRRLVEQIPVITYIAYKDFNKGMLYISPQLETILSYHPSEWLHDPVSWWSHVHPDDKERVLEVLSQELQNGDKFQMEYRLLSKKGEVAWVRDDALVLQDDPNRPALIQGVIVDITERKRSEIEIRHQAARAEALLRVASRLNAHLDFQAVIKAVCQEAAQGLGVEAAAVYLYNDETSTFNLAGGSGIPENIRNLLQPIPRSLYDQSIQTFGITGIVRELKEIPGLADYAEIKSSGVPVAFSSMLQDQDVIGLLGVISLDENQRFGQEELALLKGISDQAALAISNSSLFEETQKRLKQVQSLRTIDQAITSSFDIRVTLGVVIEQVSSSLGVSAVDILLIDPYTQTLSFVAGRGIYATSYKQTGIRLIDTSAGQVVLERQLLSIPDIRISLDGLTETFADHPGLEKTCQLMQTEGFKAYFAVPLISKGQVKGVMELYHRDPLYPDREWLEFLETLATQLAIAIDSSELFLNLERSNIELSLAYDTTLEGWSRALDMRDSATEGHTQRVTDLTVSLARGLGVPEADLVHIRRGALLHDIGKMAIPDSILQKPGQLTAKEWEIMRKHPQYAYEMLSPISFLRPALDIPYYHHERWDGSGYPIGLKAQQIPQAARIFAIVDVWDALLSDRPYRFAKSKEETIEYMRSQSGIHFDPEILGYFFSTLRED